MPTTPRLLLVDLQLPDRVVELCLDAISLSMANLATMNPESLLIAARTIVIAVVANTLVKAVMAAFMGAPALRRTVSLATILLLIAAGGGILVA